MKYNHEEHFPLVVVAFLLAVIVTLTILCYKSDLKKFELRCRSEVVASGVSTHEAREFCK